jgi:SAM-dependent methyltransferase
MPYANRDIRPQKLGSWEDEKEVLIRHIKDLARDDRPLEILEAGCGRRWGLELEGVDFRLTGVDNNQDALDFRKGQGDLNVAILGDLNQVDLEKNRYDVIYSSNVLEHVDGAEKVLENFITWLKPGGILALIFPNRDSVKGFLTRTTPFRFHVFYKRYIQGWKDAGTPGSDPFPTFFDKVVSRKGMRQFCERHGLSILGEYYSDQKYTRPAFRALAALLTWGIHLISLRTLSADKTELVYIIKRSES